MEEVFKMSMKLNSALLMKYIKKLLRSIVRSIRLKDVEYYLNKRDGKQTHFKYKKYHSFLARK